MRVLIPHVHCHTSHMEYCIIWLTWFPAMWPIYIFGAVDNIVILYFFVGWGNAANGRQAPLDVQAIAGKRYLPGDILRFPRFVDMAIVPLSHARHISLTGTGSRMGMCVCVNTSQNNLLTSSPGETVQS